MSYSLRERLRRRIAEGKTKLIEKYEGLTLEDLKWLTENYIEEICSEGDKRCNKIDPLKAVDQVIDDMDDEAFDKFVRGILAELKARLEKTKKLNKNLQKKKERKKISDDEETLDDEDQESDYQKEEEAIVA